MIAEKNIKYKYKAINNLAKKYNTLDYYINLATSLKSVFPSENFDHFTKYELHKRLNETILENYKGEEILKYKLFENYINKKNLIAAFETSVNNSRVDFLTINGCTTSFEIKSELDNLSKLSKQIADYQLVFEYNYLVVDEKHIEKAKKILPKSYGLWCYKKDKYQKLKKAELNDKIDPEVQLSVLTKQELIEAFPETNGLPEVILDRYDLRYINLHFKKTLKSRYKSRWCFLKDNQDSIFPIDVQFFFNTNIEPKYIYNH